MINKWREVRYTDDGCSLYQCLSCKQDWEARNSPEYGWRFCPYCGVEWTGGVKGRSHGNPKWQWNLIDNLYQSEEPDYKLLQARQTVVEENQRKLDENKTLWVIEYLEKDRWYCQDAFSKLINSIGPIHKAAHARMQDYIKEYEKEIEENKRYYDDDGFREKVYPTRQWRLRIMKKSEFQKLYPSKYTH